MNYDQTVQWMFSRLPMYQRQGSVAFKKDLTNIIALCKVLGDPQNNFKSIHIAGTNGKGSSSHMLASILQEAGFKVGLYTSPHLKDFRERIRVNGKPIPKEEVVQFIDSNKDFLEQRGLSFFELTVGLAFDFFDREDVDFAVVEVGLGGRLDSTNVITPVLSLITNIGFDHMQFLGNTLEEIAFEKAGIIKPGIPVVISEKQPETTPVFERKANSLGAPIYFAEEKGYPEYPSDLMGIYQKRNQKGVLQSVDILRELGFEIDKKVVSRALVQVKKNTGLMGRWQILREKPKVICDTAHNKEGLYIVLDQLSKEKYDRLIFVLGFVNDKKLDDILVLFPKDAVYFFCKPNIPRGLDAVVLGQMAKEAGLKGEICHSVEHAYLRALNHATASDLIYVGGSTFVVAEMDLE